MDKRADCLEMLGIVINHCNHQPVQMYVPTFLFLVFLFDGGCLRPGLSSGRQCPYPSRVVVVVLLIP